MNIQQRLAAKRAGKLYGFNGGFRRVYPVHHAKNGTLVISDLRQLSGLREYKFADEVLDLRNTGWYRDSFREQTYRGQVWRLPARNGAEQFLAGYVDNDGQCAIIEPEAFDDEREAARRADHLAERDAQEEREYSERWQEANSASDDLEVARESLALARAKARGMIKAIRAQGTIVPELCAILIERMKEARDEMREAIEAINAARDRIAELGMEGEF